MSVETVFFIKDGLDILGPMNKDSLVSQISLGTISKDFLWSSNQLIWASLSTIPGMQVSKIKVQNLKEPKTGVFVSTEVNRIPTTASTGSLLSAHQIGLVLGLGGIFVMVLFLLSILVFADSSVKWEEPIPVNKNQAQGKKENRKAMAEDPPPEIPKQPAQPQGKKENQKAMAEAPTPEIPKQPAQPQKEAAPNAFLFPFIPKPAIQGKGLRLNSEDIFEQCAPSVAQISSDRGSGSGFLVAEGILVTNDHVVRPKNIGDEVNIKFHSAKGKEAEVKRGKIVKRIPHRDLAFILVETKLANLVFADFNKLKPGQEIVAIGSPGLEFGVLPNTISKGVIGGKSFIGLQEMLQLNISVNGGNSGGPAIDVFGKVVGAITSTAIGKEGIAFCVPSDQILEELKNLDKE